MKPFENIVGKGKKPAKFFSCFSYTVFYPIKHKSHYMSKNQCVVCKRFEFGPGLKVCSLVKGWGQITSFEQQFDLSPCKHFQSRDQSKILLSKTES